MAPIASDEFVGGGVRAFASLARLVAQERTHFASASLRRRRLAAGTRPAVGQQLSRLFTHQPSGAGLLSGVCSFGLAARSSQLKARSSKLKAQSSKRKAQSSSNSNRQSSKLAALRARRRRRNNSAAVGSGNLFSASGRPLPPRRSF